MRRHSNKIPLRCLLVLLLTLSLRGFSQKLELPANPDAFRFAIMGDNGTGGRPQYDIAKQMTEWRTKFPFEIVLMMGDNLYGGESPRDFQKKFEIPYKPLLDAGVKFYATLGNHDDSSRQLSYKNFNMNGERFYSFRPRPGIRFFVLDSNYMDRTQFAWLQEQLRSSGSEWKICYFHHPLYSSGDTHGSDVQLRSVLEPLFVQFGVSVVFSGHEHFYERIKPQQGIFYFISGAGGQLRRGDIRKTELTAKGFDADNSFMLLEIIGDELYFQTLSRKGVTIDSGVILRPQAASPNGSSPVISSNGSNGEAKPANTEAAKPLKAAAAKK